MQSIAIALSPLRGFEERWDLYRSEQNPSGELDRHRWRATDAVYSTSVSWFTAGGARLHIEGQANFVVIEDLLKAAGQEGKFLIYRWEDLGPGDRNVAQSSR